jgi:hypothetical protein
MGSANPQNIEAMAAAGDPRAIAVMQQRQALMQGAQGGGGMPPQGGPPQGPPPGIQPGPGGGVTMPQSQFTRQAPPNPDADARRTQMLIQLLQQHQAPMGAGQ